MPDRSALRVEAAAGEPARIVVLTGGSPYGVGVVRQLAERGIACTVALQSQTALRDCFRARGWRRVGELPVALARAVLRRRRTLVWRRALARWAPRIVVTGGLNSGRMVADLAHLAPDLLVLAGVGIVDQAVLAESRWGTINGHPGLLPWVRGSGVVAHAVARGVAIGATVHRVDAGIDTGAVLARRLLPVAPGATLVTLEAAAISLAATLLADVVAEVAAGRALPAGIPQGTRTPLCRWMAPAPRQKVEAAVAQGEAERLFTRWRAACEPEVPPWDLRPEAMLPARESPPDALPDPAS